MFHYPIAKTHCNCLPHLPILTSDNYELHFDWHKYYTKVYGEPVTRPVDLNTFTWFYWFSPLGRIRVCSVNSIYIYRTNFMDNLPWIGIYGPEKTLGAHGFFVKRPVRSALLSQRRLEVLRVRDSVGVERGCCWFYHTVGSGVFVGRPNRLMILKDRNNWPALKAHCLFNEMGKSAHKFLVQRGIKCLIFTRAFQCYNGIPRTEVIILDDNFSGTATDLSLTFTQGLFDIRKAIPCDTNVLQLKPFKTKHSSCLLENQPIQTRPKRYHRFRV